MNQSLVFLLCMATLPVFSCRTVFFFFLFGPGYVKVFATACFEVTGTDFKASQTKWLCMSPQGTTI